MKPTNTETVIADELPKIQNLECDGATRVLHYALDKAGIKHQTYHGLVKFNGKVIPLHYWIELSDGRILDYKLRMWLGSDAPEGIFEQKGIKYSGVAINLPVNETLYNILTFASGGEIQPHKEVSASKTVATKEVAEKYGLSEMEAAFLYQMKEKNIYECDYEEGLKKAMFEKLKDKGFLEYEGYANGDFEYVLPQKSKDFITALEARIETRRGVKAGYDLFPEQAAIPEFKSVAPSTTPPATPSPVQASVLHTRLKIITAKLKTEPNNALLKTRLKLVQQMIDKVGKSESESDSNSINWVNMVELASRQMMQGTAGEGDFYINKVAKEFSKQKNIFANPKAEEITFSKLKDEVYKDKIEIFIKNKLTIQSGAVDWFCEKFNLDKEEFIKRAKGSLKQYAEGGLINGLTAEEAFYLWVKRGLKAPYREKYLRPLGLFQTEKSKAVEEKLKKIYALNGAGAITEQGKELAKQIDVATNGALSRIHQNSIYGVSGNTFSDKFNEFDSKYFLPKLETGGNVGDRFFEVSITEKWKETPLEYMHGRNHAEVAAKLPLKSKRITNERFRAIEQTGSYYRVEEVGKGGKAFIFEILEPTKLAAGGAVEAKRNIWVRFNLSNDENFMKWKIENKETGAVTYLAPSEVQIVMYNCKLTNSPATAQKIFTGQMTKAPIAYVRCESAEILYSSTYKIKEEDWLKYNPRKAPNWQDNTGNNIDNTIYPRLITKDRGVYVYHKDNSKEKLKYDFGGEVDEEISESKMGENWRDNFEQLKANNDLDGIETLYSKVRVVLNGIAQSKGEATVKDFQLLKKEIEDFAATVNAKQPQQKDNSFSLSVLQTREKIIKAKLKSEPNNSVLKTRLKLVQKMLQVNSINRLETESTADNLQPTTAEKYTEKYLRDRDHELNIVVTSDYPRERVGEILDAIRGSEGELFNAQWNFGSGNVNGYLVFANSWYHLLLSSELETPPSPTKYSNRTRLTYGDVLQYVKKGNLTFKVAENKEPETNSEDKEWAKRGEAFWNDARKNAKKLSEMSHNEFNDWMVENHFGFYKDNVTTLRYVSPSAEDDAIERLQNQVKGFVKENVRDSRTEIKNEQLDKIESTLDASQPKNKGGFEFRSAKNIIAWLRANNNPNDEQNTKIVVDNVSKAIARLESTVESVRANPNLQEHFKEFVAEYHAYSDLLKLYNDWAGSDSYKKIATWSYGKNEILERIKNQPTPYGVDRVVGSYLKNGTGSEYERDLAIVEGNPNYNAPEKFNNGLVRFIYEQNEKADKIEADNKKWAKTGGYEYISKFPKYKQNEEDILAHRYLAEVAETLKKKVEPITETKEPTTPLSLIHQINFPAFLSHITLRNNSSPLGKQVEVMWFDGNGYEILFNIPNSNSESKDDEFNRLQLEKYHQNKVVEAMERDEPIDKNVTDFYQSDDSVLVRNYGGARMRLALEKYALSGNEEQPDIEELYAAITPRVLKYAYEAGDEVTFYAAGNELIKAKIKIPSVITDDGVQVWLTTKGFKREDEMIPAIVSAAQTSSGGGYKMFKGLGGSKYYEVKFADGDKFTSYRSDRASAIDEAVKHRLYQAKDFPKTKFEKTFTEALIPINKIRETNSDGQKLADAITDVKDGLTSKTEGKILVYKHPDSTFEIADGFHRVAEAILRGDESILADVTSPPEYSDGGGIPKYDLADLKKFAANAVFKKTKHNGYEYFNISTGDQIRIRKVSGNENYRVTLHRGTGDGYTHLPQPDKNIFAKALETAKIEAAKIYYDEIRADVSTEIDIADRQIDFSNVPTDELKKLGEKSVDFSEMAAIKKELDSRKLASGGIITTSPEQQKIIDAKPDEFVTVYHASSKPLQFIQPSDSSNYAYAEKGFVYVAVTPENAAGYIRFHNAVPYVHKIRIKKEELLPDKGMIKAYGGKNTLEESISRYGLARIKRPIYGNEIESVEQYSKGGSLVSAPLLAPNGQPSNLNPIQYALVRTAEFKAWFGDWEKLAFTKLNDSGIDEVTLSNLSKKVSKVVDENGEPLVVYHGSATDITEFKPQKVRYGNHKTQSAHFFTDNIEIAKEYSKLSSLEYDEWGQRKIGAIMECFISSKTPKQINANNQPLTKYVTDTEIKAIIKENDAIIVKNAIDAPSGKFYETPQTIIICFLSNQIKLADGTNQTFEGSNADIRYAIGGEIMSRSQIESALHDVDYAPSVKYWMQPEFSVETAKYPQKGEPNSFKRLAFKGTVAGGKKWASDDIVAYDANGDIVGSISIDNTLHKGALKIVVRENSQRVGWGTKLLDEAEREGIEIIFKSNSYTSAGRALAQNWLEQKLKLKHG